MKAVFANDMKRLEQQALSINCSEEEFMDRAALQISVFIESLYVNNPKLSPRILFLCGKGNNGGDAIASAYYLMKRGFYTEIVYVFPNSKVSPLNAFWKDRYESENGNIGEFVGINITHFDVIIDGIFGIGFQQNTCVELNDVICLLKNSHRIVVSIDVPSGVCDSYSTSVINSDYTLFLGLPKIECFLNGNSVYLGQIKVLDFGLPKEIIDSVDSGFELILNSEIELPNIARDCNKYQRGYVIGVSGGTMSGAGILSSMSSYRSGAGIVRALIPRASTFLSENICPEVIKTVFDENSILEDPVLNLEIQRCNSCFIGPGSGIKDYVKTMIEGLFVKYDKSCVIDADAISLYRINKFNFPKQKTVFTPHLGELKKLLDIENEDKSILEMIQDAQSFCIDNKAIIVVKGLPSFICSWKEPIKIMYTGCSGMAVAGSGDVLTGVIATLLAQGLSPLSSAITGVMLHGMAGIMASKFICERSMMSLDLIDYIDKSYLLLLDHKH